MTAGVSYTCAAVAASTKGWCSAWPQRACSAAASTPADARAETPSASERSAADAAAAPGAGGAAERSSAEPLRCGTEGGERVSE